MADAEPLAVALQRAGFGLHSVVALIDGEAGLGALQHDIAQAQVDASLC